MKEKGISHETLKLIATVTMLIDHIGAVLAYEWYMAQSIAAGAHIRSLWNLYLTMRVIGRIAFPIYCFLLVEGAYHTRNPGKYGLRLLMNVLLSEIPFDLAFSGAWDMTSNNVMITLLLGFGMVLAMKRVTLPWKLLLVLPFYFLAELLKTDYAGNGILIIAFLALTREMPYEKLLRLAGMTVLLCFGAMIQLGHVRIPLELFGILGVLFCFCYGGRKISNSKAVQWAFYLFYPVHLLVLWAIKIILFGV